MRKSRLISNRKRKNIRSKKRSRSKVKKSKKNVRRMKRKVKRTELDGGWRCLYCEQCNIENIVDCPNCGLTTDTLRPAELLDAGYFFDCPQCHGFILVSKHDFNCGVFRHGTYKSTGLPINPHLPKAECDRLVATKQINGCGKPFEIKRSHNGNYYMVKCDYK